LRVLITGGSGFIGTNLVENFLARQDEVVNLDIVAPRNPAHTGYWRYVDLRDSSAVRLAVQAVSPEIVLHMGARTDLEGRSIKDYAANTVGVDNLITALEGLRDLRHVVFASSRLVCRIGYQPVDEFDYCPSTPYGESKVVGEKIVRDADQRIPSPWVIVRPTSIWGPWFGVPYKTFFLAVAHGRYRHPGHVRVLKSFGFVGNTMYALQQLLDAPSHLVSKKTLYLADYPPIDIAEMANTIQQALGVAPIRSVSIGLLRSAAWVGDCLKVLGWREPPLTSFRLNNLLTPMVHNTDPLQAVVGDLPYPMQQGVEITVNWLRIAGEVPQKRP